MVEAAGVELFGVLITRNLLILGTATTAKKAPLPDPLYVYCTKMLFALESHRHTLRPQYPKFAVMGREKAPSFPCYRESPPFHFFGTPAPLFLPVVREPGQSRSLPTSRLPRNIIRSVEMT